MGSGPSGASPSPTDDGSAAGGTAPEVAVRHLRASYDRRVFTDVSFTAPAGLVTVVSGPSGIGKTTLIRILLGRLGPDRGDVTVGTRSTIGASPAQLAAVHARTAFLFSGLDAGAEGRKGFHPGSDDVPDDGVEPRRSVADNVKAVSASDDRARQSLTDFDLDDVADERADRLDGGAARRLRLARVFATDPALVLLDDPVAALSPAERDAVVAGLVRARTSSRADPATVVLACHDLTTTREVGDRLVTLISGRVRREGAVSELLEGIETDHAFASAYAVGGKEIAEKSSKALGEHRTSVGLHDYDQRLFIGAITVLGVLFLAAIVAVVAFRVLL